MELKRLLEKRTDNDYNDLVIIDKALQAKERVESIIENLHECFHGDKGRPHDPRDSMNVLQGSPEQSLKDLLFDSNADNIFKNAEEALNNVSNKKIGEILESFLRTYKDFRKREEEIISQNRETILVNLKKELERICNEDRDTHNNNSFPYLAVNPREDESSGYQDRSEAKINESNESKDTVLASVLSTINSLDGLKLTFAQMKVAKTQMKDLCTSLEYRKIKKDTNHEEAIAGAAALCERLSEMKQSLCSYRCNSNNKSKCERILIDMRKELTEATEAHEHWKIYEAVTSSSVEQRKKNLRDLKLCLRNHEGTSQKEEIRCKKLGIESHKLRLSQGILTMNAKLREMELDMLTFAKQYRTLLNANLRRLDKTFFLFESLENSFRDARNEWSKKQPSSGINEAMTSKDRMLEQRLIKSINKIMIEKRMLAEERKFIHFVAQDDSLSSLEKKSSLTADLIDLMDNQTMAGARDMLSNVTTLTSSIDDFDVMAKCTFLTMKALNGLDGCLAYSPNKLEIINFDIIHQVTYFEAREKALILPHVKETRKEKQTCGVHKASRVSSQSSQPEKQISRKILKNSENHFKTFNYNETCEEISIVHKVQRQSYVDTTKGQSYPCMPTTKLTSTEFLADNDKTSLTIFPSIEDNNSVTQKGPMMSYGGGPEKEKDVDEEFIRQLGAIDMARHFRFHGQTWPSRRCSPTRFLFYTKGVGVFKDDNGELVDALGLPFPKQRQSFLKSLQHPSMTIRGLIPIRKFKGRNYHNRCRSLLHKELHRY